MSGFADLADRLAELEDIPSRIAGEVADAITEDLRQQFDQGVDPYGAPWRPLLPSTVRRKRGDARILRRGDTLSSSTVAKATSGAGIEITSLDYGGVHQAGETLAKRAILPDGDDLPPAWLNHIETATDKTFAKALR